MHMWNPGDVIAWRGIYRDHVWHAQTTLVVSDTPAELVLALLPGAECIAHEDYAKGNVKHSWWNFEDKDWKLEKYLWRTNRLLILHEPEKYYSTIYFWNNESNEFLCYYINFQLPFKRSHCGIDILDLDLDLIIHPDFSVEWKDVEDYQKAVDNAAISPEWIRGIEFAKQDVFSKLEMRSYPLDGSWLNWMPKSTWSPPKLPENWDKI